MKRTDPFVVVVVGLAIYALGRALAADPTCRDGCQTVAHSISRHGLQTALHGLGVRWL